MDWRTAPLGSSDSNWIVVVGEGPDTELLPSVFRAGLNSASREGDSLRLDCAEDEFEACIEHLASCGIKAVAIGNPHKVAAARLAKEFFVVKHALGVANALNLGSHVYAQNTEVPGFVRTIANLPPATALVMGSGRAARSAVMGLYESGWKVRLWNRALKRSKPMITLFQRYGRIEPTSQADPAGCSLIVNATPLGRRAGEQPPVVWNHASRGATAIDFVFRNVSTEFLRSASARGLGAIDGRKLLVEQAAFALEWWFNCQVSRAPMLEATGLRQNDAAMPV